MLTKVENRGIGMNLIRNGKKSKGKTVRRTVIARGKKCRHDITKRPIAILLIAVMLLSAIPIIENSNSTEGTSDDTTSVVYHMYVPGDRPAIDPLYNIPSLQSEDRIPSITVQYRGVVSTEYNPQKWKGTIKGEITSGDDSDWFHIRDYNVGSTVVFTGWVYQKGTGTQASYSSQNGMGHYPGEVLNDPDQYSLINGAIHAYATWDVLKNYSLVSGTTMGSSTISSWNDDGNAFTNIMELAEGQYAMNGDALTKPLTITGQGERTLVALNTQVSLSEDCIIDEVSIRNKGPVNGNHGYGFNCGLYAQGHTLVLGTGLTASLSVSEANSNNAVKYLLQVVGGSYNGTVDKTNVIIHSGYYYTVIAGGQGRGGSSTVVGDTNVTIRGGTVLDTVVGGCSGETDRVGGDTHVYLLGDARMPGDYYEERFLDGSYNLIIGNEIKTTESSILTGGSNKSWIEGDTFVHISNDAQAWDVQGAGRGGLSTVKGTANVHVSGDALIKHVVNGSITDGLNGSTVDGSPYRKGNECVKNTNIVISDNARVASIFGAGYDTFYASNYSSMYNGGTISIRVEGGTVGYVYGGGYRGSIGAESNTSKDASPLDRIKIDIEGGTILHDVYGGGRGGLDKVCHNSDGTVNWGSSQNDTVGHSKVFVKELEISIGANAKICGNVYGGGESTPIITSYDGTTAPYENKTLGGSGDDKVAAVECDNLTIRVDGTILGSVFGAGKGVDINDITDGRHSSAYIFAMDSNGGFKSIPWIKGNGGSTTYSSDDMGAFASMTAGTVGVSIGSGAEIEDSVYGGGALGTLSGRTADKLDITVNIEGSANVCGSVFGGGMGQDRTEDDAGKIDAESIRINIHGGKVSQSIYGGGAQSRTFANDISVIIGNNDAKTAVSVAGSIYGGGMGSTSLISAGYTESNISVTVNNDASVKGSVFGGGQLAQIQGNAITTISATINGNVFGGGLGTQSSTSTVNTKRTVKILDGARIGGSVFGSSSLGNDIVSGTNGSSDSFISILGGRIEGSVFGGGLKGTTYGSTAIDVFSDSDIRIEGSVYGGADIGNNDDSTIIGATLVYGDSAVTAIKRKGTLYIGGSVFGSGNSCLVSGTKNVSITGLIDSTMQSFQNIDSLVIKSSEITLNGRTSGESSQVSTIHSMRNIHDLTLIDGTTLELRVSAVNIGSLTSCISDGVLSDVSSPSNKIVICDGHIISVDYDDAYGRVYGYAIIQTDMNTENGGVYIYGSIGSEGGFVTIRDGVFERMNSADFDLPDRVNGAYRCWYMKGGITRTASIVADGAHNEGEVTSTKTGSITIPKMGGASTRLVFYGYEVRTYNQSAFNLVGDDVGIDPNQYMMEIGRFSSVNNGSMGGFLTLHADRAIASRSFALDGSHLNYVLTTSASITFTGKVAEITILLWESTEDAHHPMNPVYVVIDIHAQSPGISDEYQDTIELKNGSGKNSIVINKGHAGTKLWVVGVSWNGMSPVAGIAIAPRINVENTDGWVTPLANPLDLYAFDPSENYLIGELSGSFSATLELSASDLQQIPEGSVTVRMALILEDGTRIESSITIHFKATETCMVKFVYWKFSDIDGRIVGKETTFETTVYQGDILPKDSIPQVDYLTGWYANDLYEIPFDFNTPIRGTASDDGSINTLTIYARQGFMATFDNGDGTQESLYVPFVMKDDGFDLDGGRLYGILSSPGTPQRNDGDDYTFYGWMEAGTGSFPLMATGRMNIYSDIGFVADWTGKDLSVIFRINVEASVTEYKGTLKYGMTYSQVIIDDNADGVKTWDEATAMAKVKGGDLNRFIRWVHGNTPVFGDMVTVDSVSPHILIAEFTVNAIEITFDSSTLPSDLGKSKSYDYDADIAVQAPQTMVVFREMIDGAYVYAFTPGNAYLRGYHLNYWTDSIDIDGNRYYAGKLYKMTEEEVERIVDKKLTLYPVFEHLRFNLTVDQPLSGSVTATPVGGAFKGQDRSNGGLVYYSDRIRLSFTGGADSWNVKGDGSITYEEDGTYLTVYGDCRVYVLYTAFRLELKINGTIAPDHTQLKLVSGTGTEYVLRSVGDGTFETNSLRGDYALHMMTENSGWLLIDRFVGIENIDDPTVELFSIHGESDEFDFPEYAKSESTVAVRANAGNADYGCLVGYDDGVLTRSILTVGTDPTFTIIGETWLMKAFVIEVIDSFDGVEIDGASLFGSVYYAIVTTDVTLHYSDTGTGWDLIGWMVSSIDTGYTSEMSPTVHVDRNISIHPIFELESSDDEVVDLGTFNYALEKSDSGMYIGLIPMGRDGPEGEFTMSFPDYGGMTLSLKDGRLNVEGLADATGTVCFPSIVYESDGVIYSISVVLYIVSDVTPADELFTLTCETETSSKGS